jgi:hypothetical protein
MGNNSIKVKQFIKLQFKTKKIWKFIHFFFEYVNN